MERKVNYIIKLSFEESEQYIEPYHNYAPYIGSTFYKDEIEISSNQILITAYRRDATEINSIFFNHNSSIYNQILKSIIYYYSLNLNCPKINEISVYKYQKSIKTEEKILSINQFTQLIDSKITTNITFNRTIIEELFQESSKGKTLLIGLSYWLKGMSSDDEFFKLRLWRGVENIYMFLGKDANGKDRNGHESRIKLREKLINNPNVLNFTTAEVQIFKGKDLRKSFQWRLMILNDYSTIKQTEAFKDFVLRYTDINVMNLLNETLVYRHDNLKSRGLLTEVNNHINTHLNLSQENDAELVSLLCLKYMYFIRNKQFHGEKIDSTFRLVENKEIIEIKKLNKLLSAFLADLINSFDVLL